MTFAPGTELEVRHEPRTMAVLTNEQLKFIAGTDFVPPGLRGNLPAILACVATGRELGIGDMSALKAIHIIDGKPTFSAELMVQLVRRAGHSIQGEVTADKAVVTGKRADNGDEMTVVWTTAMAERAGLLKKQNWVKYVESMLWARAASQLCRMLFADCFAGATYTPEELENSVGEPQAENAADDGQSVSLERTVSTASRTQDERSSPTEPLMTEAQKKKANTLVGKLRSEGRLTTEEIYTAVGLNPIDFLDEKGELHWSPLRDTLPKKQASALIDLLQKHEESGEPVLLDPWHYDPPETAPLEVELITLAERLGKRADVEAALDRKRGDTGFEEWLQAQVVRARGACAASEEAA